MTNPHSQIKTPCAKCNGTGEYFWKRPDGRPTLSPCDCTKQTEELDADVENFVNLALATWPHKLTEEDRGGVRALLGIFKDKVSQPDAALAQSEWKDKAALYSYIQGLEATNKELQQKAKMLDEIVEASKTLTISLQNYEWHQVKKLILVAAAFPSTPPATSERDKVIEECAEKIDWYKNHYAKAGVDWQTGGTDGEEFIGAISASVRALKSSPKQKDGR